MSVEVRPHSDDEVMLVFALPVHEPRGSVSVVGSFNGWVAGRDELRVEDGGVIRSARTHVPKGSTVYFRYLAEDGRWFDDADADEIDAHGSVLRAVGSAFTTEPVVNSIDAATEVPTKAAATPRRTRKKKTT